MSDSFRGRTAASPPRLAWLSLIVVASVSAAPAAWSQTPPAASFNAAAPPPTGEPPARRENPGLINEIGKLWDKSSTMLPSLLPQQDPVADPAAGLSPPAAPGPAMPPPPALAMPAPPASLTAPSRPSPPPASPPPPTSNPAASSPATPDSGLVPTMVSGRTQCPTADNGAPDCTVAAAQLCQAKGYREGKSLASDSTEACSAKRLIPGRERKPEDCRTNYFVTRAFCQ